MTNPQVVMLAACAIFGLLAIIVSAALYAFDHKSWTCRFCELTYDDLPNEASWHDGTCCKECWVFRIALIDEASRSATPTSSTWV